MIWAVESLHKGKWVPSEGALFTTRLRARLNMKWFKRNLPGEQFRIKTYSRTTKGSLGAST